jgi:hypothetical protein
MPCGCNRGIATADRTHGVFERPHNWIRCNGCCELEVAWYGMPSIQATPSSHCVGDSGHSGLPVRCSRCLLTGQGCTTWGQLRTRGDSGTAQRQFAGVPWCLHRLACCKHTIIMLGTALYCTAAWIVDTSLVLSYHTVWCCIMLRNTHVKGAERCRLPPPGPSNCSNEPRSLPAGQHHWP